MSWLKISRQVKHTSGQPLKVKQLLMYSLNSISTSQYTAYWQADAALLKPRQQMWKLLRQPNGIQTMPINAYVINQDIPSNII